jgi:cytochrome P450
MTTPDRPVSPALPEPPEADEQFDIGATEDSLDRMVELFAHYGDIYRVYAPGRKSYTWIINHPDDVKRVLVGNHRNYTKGTGLDRVKILLGNGIMTSEGDMWRRQRSMMQPLFHRRVVTEFNELIDAANSRFLEKWAAQAARGELVNLTDDMSELTLQIVLGSIFGKDLATLTRQPGGNPFEVVTRETDPGPEVRLPVPLARQAGLRASWRAAAPRRPSTFDYLGMLMNARDKETGDPMTERALIDEVMTLDRRRPRDHRQRPELGLVPARHDTLQADARMHAEIEATPELAAPGLRADGAARNTPRTSSMKRCACIRPAGSYPAAPSRPIPSPASRSPPGRMYC